MEVEQILRGVINNYALQKIGKGRSDEARELSDKLLEAVPYILKREVVPGIDEKVTGTSVFDRNLLKELTENEEL